MEKNEKFLLESEKRFRKFSEEKVDDLSFYPLTENNSNIKINKLKSKQFSEVFTPLWLVDQMIDQVHPQVGATTLDLCAGYGQFSIRLMRYFYQLHHDFDVVRFLKETHAFSELQLSSCYKLLSIFGININLFIGDSTQLSKLPAGARGLWCYVESYGYWVSLTQTIKNILLPHGTGKGNKAISEVEFVRQVEALLVSLNTAYVATKEMHMITLQQLMRHSSLRQELIHQINASLKGISLQDVDTPISVIDDMIAQVADLEKKSILVLFNCEIVERLITKYKIDPQNITFGVDFTGSMKAEFMKKMYGVDTVLMSNKFLFVHQEFKGRKFDVCFSNPPYNDHLHLKILMALLGGSVDYSIAKEYVIVHPANWLIDQKGEMAIFNNFKNTVAKILVNVSLFNGNTVFNIGLFYPCVITHINHNHSGPIDVKYFNDIYRVESIDHITKYGKSWDTIVQPLFANLKKFIKVNGSVWDRNIKQIGPNMAQHCQLAAIRGHVGPNGNLFSDDFYTMVMMNSDNNKGIRKEMDKRPGPTFEFATIQERDNFIGYLKTDFARFCLSLYKIGANLFYGEMAMIPWLDFTQSWDDDKLFTHFDIDQTTQDYIRSFLPDYYGIRKKHDGNQTAA